MNVHKYDMYIHNVMMDTLDVVGKERKVLARPTLWSIAGSRSGKTRAVIVDRMYYWQQCLVTISDDISTIKYDFDLR